MKKNNDSRWMTWRRDYNEEGKREEEEEMTGVTKVGIDIGSSGM